MNFKEKLRTTFSKVTWPRSKKITVFISILDKRAAAGEYNPSRFIGEKKSVYTHADKWYIPKKIFFFLPVHVKKGYIREQKSVPRFQVVEWYRKFCDTQKRPVYRGSKVYFQEIHLKPKIKNEDEQQFSETRNHEL